MANQASTTEKRNPYPGEINTRPGSTAARRRGGVIIALEVNPDPDSSACAKLAVVWQSDTATARRARLGVLHRIAAEVCAELDHYGAVDCADPEITMGNDRGAVRLELVRLEDYVRAAAVLARAAETALGLGVVIK